jgi:phage-related protein
MWFDQLSEQAKIRCRARLQQLAQQGYLLRRPAADFLQSGIYQLRAKAGRVQYRMLYFFHGTEVVVVSHRIVKKDAAVPLIEIERAIWRRRSFEAHPELHAFELIP